MVHRETEIVDWWFFFVFLGPVCYNVPFVWRRFIPSLVRCQSRSTFCGPTELPEVLWRILCAL